jgi:F-type H+-transporting ATPase subunit epsilon
MNDIQCVVVTPEKTEIDVFASSVTVPLFDGELGILKNHSPLVGRLGFGILRFTSEGGSTSKYFVEGGFVQVAANVVSILTDQVRPLSSVTRQSADAAMNEAIKMAMGSAEERNARQKAVNRARAMQRVAS